MRVRKTETVEVTRQETRVIRDEVSCDMCGRPARHPDSYRRGRDHVNWSGTVGVYTEVDATLITRATGYDAPEGGAVTVKSLHICPDCWVKLAAEVRAARGAEPTVEEVEW